MISFYNFHMVFDNTSRVIVLIFQKKSALEAQNYLYNKSLKKKVTMAEVALGNLKFQKRPPIIKNSLQCQNFSLCGHACTRRTTRKKAFIASALRASAIQCFDSIPKKS